SLPFQTSQVRIIELICYRHVFFIPAIVSCLVAANQQSRSTARIERIQNARGRPSCWIRNSRIWLCFEFAIPEQCGHLIAIHGSARRRTAESMLTCSSWFREYHHVSNSSTNSTSQTTPPICHISYIPSRL